MLRSRHTTTDALLGWCGFGLRNATRLASYSTHDDKKHSSSIITFSAITAIVSLRVYDIAARCGLEMLTSKQLSLTLSIDSAIEIYINAAHYNYKNFWARAPRTKL